MLAAPSIYRKLTKGTPAQSTVCGHSLPEPVLVAGLIHLGVKA